MNHSEHQPPQSSPVWSLLMKVSSIAFAVIVASYLIGQRWVHVANILPFFFILLCPLMHLFMHGGHGGHGHDSTKDDDSGSRPKSP
jgi:hypothetical protein